MKADAGIDALSEKEREALRLLLAGHDAKSSAQILGVSHHAIHDRLRCARRKLGTTGSRQAALLLSEAEKATPDSVVHEPFGGEAAAPSRENPSRADMKRSTSFWSQRRRKGLIIVSASILIIAAAIAINTGGGSPPKSPDAVEAGASGSTPVTVGPTQTTAIVPPAAARSVAAARQFMTLVEAGDAAASYQAAAPTFRNAHGFDLWRLGVALRASEGEARRRTLVDVEVDAAPSNPSHEALEILTFDVIMLNGERKSERLVMALIDGAWRVVNIDTVDADEN